MSIQTDTVLLKVTTKKSKNKKPREYLHGRTIEDTPIDSSIKWFVSTYDVSERLWSYRQQCKSNAFSHYLDSDIEEIALNSIFFISKKNERYNIPEQVYKDMINELEKKYSTSVNFEKYADKDVKRAKKAASDLVFDNEFDNETMSESVLRVLQELERPSSKKLQEDKLSKRYVESVLGPFIKSNKHNRIFGDRSESKGSKARREGEGVKSDFGLKAVYKDFEHHLLHVEIKPASSDNGHHPDFVKLCNLLKDEIDLLLMEDCPTEIPVFCIFFVTHQ